MLTTGWIVPAETNVCAALTVKPPLPSGVTTPWTGPESPASPQVISAR